MAYIDGFVIAAPTADKEKFLDHARRMDTIFIEFGATRVVEAWGDDVPDGKLTDFKRAVQAKAETSKAELEYMKAEISYRVAHAQLAAILCSE